MRTILGDKRTVIDKAIVATGLVIDLGDLGSLFPSAGGNSADPRVQAVYWRCAAVMLASARLFNPDVRVALFTNATPPVIDGIDLVQVFNDLRVEVRQVHAHSRLPPSKAATFGNVLYFIDIFDSLASEPDDTPVVLLDCDVVVTHGLGEVVDCLITHDFLGYQLDTPAREDINGLDRTEMTACAKAIEPGLPNGPIAHFGGEIFGCSLGTWRGHRALFHRLLGEACSGAGAGAGVRTEEHMFSIAFAATGAWVALANPFLKRIWTSPRHSTVARGDEDLALWHLPAEKRYGLADLFRELANCGFVWEGDPEEFRRLAGRLCGVPSKNFAKIARDGVRQIAGKAGLRV